MPLEIDGAPPSLPPRRWASIAAVEEITPRVRRLRLTGPDLQGFAIPAPGAHVKLILPAPGDTRPAIPLRYEAGQAVWAPDAKQPFLRTYTPRRFDPGLLELEIDLLVHGAGMASEWVQRAQPGDEILVAGPRGGWTVPGDGEWFVVAADETALPAAEQVLCAIPDGASVTTLFEVADSAEERLIPGTEGRGVRWLPRAGATPGSLLESSIGELDVPSGRGYVWIACEADAMRRIRRHLVERGLPGEQMVTRGYWKLGTVDHPDGDYGQDDLGHGH